METPLIFNNTLEKEERYREHYNKFLKYKQEKEQNLRFFYKNDTQRNIYDYVKDSVDRMNEYREKPNWKEDWQHNLFDPVTRDKLIAILSTLASTRMKPELIVKPLSIFATDDVRLRKTIYSDLLEAANIKNQEEEQLVWEIYTGLSEGTLIGYEGWHRGSRDVEYVKEFNPDTGEVVKEKVKHDQWDDVYGEIVPIEEFFPETIWVNANEFKRKVSRCFRAREMTFASFKDTFGNFSGADKVFPAGSYLESNYFEWGIPNSVNHENVFVLQYYDEINDKYGLWVNGRELYYDCIPFNHKRIPFWVAITEPIHHQLLWGKSLPDKLMGMQDVNNGVLNAMLDQLFLALNSPLFTDSDLDLDENYLEPGRIIKGEPGSKIERLALGQVDPIAFQILNLIKRSMEETSVSAQFQGVPTGGRKTKYEVQQLREGALNIAALALQMMERAITQKYLLRMYNILQYYSMPSRTKTGKKKFKFIELENRRLTNGKIGKRKIQIVGSATEIPTKEELAKIAEAEEGKEFNPLESTVEPIVVTRDYLLNKELELEIRIVPNSSVKQSEIDKKNKDIAFYQAVAGNPLFDQKEVAKDFARAFDKPESIVVETTPQAPAAVPGLPGMPGMKGQPGGGQQITTEDLL